MSPVRNVTYLSGRAQLSNRYAKHAASCASHLFLFPRIEQAAQAVAENVKPSMLTMIASRGKSDM